MEYQQQRETFEQVNEATSPQDVFWTMDCYRGSVAVQWKRYVAWTNANLGWKSVGTLAGNKFHDSYNFAINVPRKMRLNEPRNHFRTNASLLLRIACKTFCHPSRINDDNLVRRISSLPIFISVDLKIWKLYTGCLKSQIKKIQLINWFLKWFRATFSFGEISVLASLTSY